MKKLEIPAIHDKDLRLILDKYNLAEKIDNREIKCTLCDNEITWENIAALKIREGSIDIYCDDPNCIENASN